MKLIVDFRGNQYSQATIIKDKKGNDKEIRIKELFKATYTDFYKWTGYGWRSPDGDGYVMPTKEMEPFRPVRFHIECTDLIKDKIAIFCNTFKIDFWSVETFDTGQVSPETQENPPEAKVEVFEPQFKFDESPEGRLRYIKNIEDAAIKRYADMRIMIVEKRIEDWIKTGKITREDAEWEKNIFLAKLSDFVNKWSLAGEKWIKTRLEPSKTQEIEEEGIPFKEPVKKSKKKIKEEPVGVPVTIKPILDMPKNVKKSESDEIMDMF